jgi:hypothetical protein
VFNPAQLVHTGIEQSEAALVPAGKIAASGQPEGVALVEQAHRPIKEPLLQAQAPGQVAPEQQQQQVGPVGGEGQRHLPLRQPSLQAFAGQAG